MADDEKPKNWWYTLPGVLTSLAAIITALAGLLAAMKQTGWLERKPTSTVASASLSASQGETAGAGPKVEAGIPAEQAARPPAGSAVTATKAAAGRSVQLPQKRDYVVQALNASGRATFTLLAVELGARSSDGELLKVRVRALNEDGAAMNFWGDSLRLLVDGVPRQPDQAPNEIVQPNAAKDADFVFALPREFQNLGMRFLHAGEVLDVTFLMGQRK
jgi:hypothetical protein